jgi:hypothetical protein
MEVLLSLALGLVLGSHFSLIPRTTHDYFDVSLFFGVGVGSFAVFHILVVGFYFLSVLWFGIKSIVRLISSQ